MAWSVRHEGSPKVVAEVTVEDIARGLRDGVWEPTDEALPPGAAQWQPLESLPQFAGVIEDLAPVAPRRHDEGTHLDMNALIDVCLVLLIFFILTTTYAASVQKVVPLPTVKGDLEKAKVIHVKDVKSRMIRVQALLDQGKPAVRVENQSVDVLASDGRSIDPDKLRDALRTYVRGDDRKSEVLLDARGISWGSVIAIQDGAKAAGVHTVHHLVRK